MIATATRWREQIEKRTLKGPRGFAVELPYVVSAAAVLVVSVLVYPFREALGTANMSLFFVLLVFLVGLAFGIGPAMASAILSFIISDFFLYPPYFTLVVEKKHHLISLVVLMGIAFIAGWLGSQLRAYTEEARREARRTTMLYDLNRALVSDVTLDQVLTTVVRGVVEIYGARACRLLVQHDADTDAFRVAARWPEGIKVPDSRQETHVARHVFDTGVVAGLGTGGRRVRMPHGVAESSRQLVRRSGEDVLYVPVGTDDERFGVLEIVGRPGGGTFHTDDQRMLKSFADQAALAVQRARLIEEATRTKVLEQSNELKSALLAAVSHDLRTPLAAIKMSASALQDRHVDWDDESRRELLSAIEESTDWLALVVDNLLDLSRIEGGALRPDRDWHDLSDLLHRVIVQMERQVAQHPVTLDIPDDLPLVYLDYVQISQVMMNLISNAVKYSEAGNGIEISASTLARGDAVEIQVTDHGKGIASTSLPHIFETFYRVRPNGDVAGSGVGLAICKGLVEAHGGDITVDSVKGEGTTIRVWLPLAQDRNDGQDSEREDAGTP